jgi:hypothetical protein
MNKKRFSPQKNISSTPLTKDAKNESTISHTKSEHLEKVVKNISQKYHEHKKNNVVKNVLFFVIFFLFLLSTAAWALPRILSFQFDSVGSFFSDINPAEVLVPENKEMNVLIL